VQELKLLKNKTKRDLIKTEETLLNLINLGHQLHREHKFRYNFRANSLKGIQHCFRKN